MLYLRAVSAQLEREGRTGLAAAWVITPVGGSGKVPAFAALLAPQKGMNVATLLDIQISDRSLIEDLYKKKLLKKKQVITYGDFVGKNEADIEDMFDRDFYVSLVNAEFAKELDTPINPAAINRKEPRTLRAVEEWLMGKPLKSSTFGHYRPARYFSENAATLWPKVSDATKDRFEAAFKTLNSLLRSGFSFSDIAAELAGTGNAPLAATPRSSGASGFARDRRRTPPPPAARRGGLPR